MVIMAVTGGIAAGKSAVMQLLKQHGAVTFSADEAARAVLSEGGSALHAIHEEFGSAAFLPNGAFDRGALASLIYKDADARERLNRIMHPRIRRLLRCQMRSVCNDFPPNTIIAVEIPLLFETGQDKSYERILVVAASKTVQLQRLMERRGLTRQEAEDRLAAQLPQAPKVAAATYVVVNNGAEEELDAQVAAVWNRLVAERDLC